jgi:hypothetical protein
MKKMRFVNVIFDKKTSTHFTIITRIFIGTKEEEEEEEEEVCSI